MLKTYTGENMDVLGECHLKAQYAGRKVVLPTVIQRETGRKFPALLGRTWFKKFQLDWRSLFLLSISLHYETERERHNFVFFLAGVKGGGDR